MQKFTKKDLIFSTITGFTAGLIGWRILVFLGRPEEFHIPMSLLVVLVPLLWIVGVNLGYFLGRWMPFFNQFGRFAAIGFTNFVVSAGILNLLIALSGINAGIWYSFFVGVAFIVATAHSYYWNKIWVFSAEGDAPVGAQGSGAVEFSKFMGVAIVAGLVNIAAASLVVNFIHPLFGIDPKGWANIGGIAGSAAALVFSFIGFRIVVFKNK